MQFDVRNASVLVTGAGGFIGSHLIAALLARGATVHAVLRPGSPAVRFQTLKLRPIIHHVDVTKVDETADLVDRLRPDVVFNLAVCRATECPRSLRQTNETAAESLLSACTHAGFRRFVSIGSSLEQQAEDQTATAYARSRAAAATKLRVLAKQLDIPLTHLRTYYVYGPLQDEGKLIPSALRAAETSESLPLAQNNFRKDYVYVSDVVRACFAAVVSDSPPYTEADIATGQQWSVQDVVCLLENLTGRPIPTRADPAMTRSWDRPDWNTDLAPARNLLGWEPQITLQQGLADLVANWGAANAA
ncbi:dTDP-4-oxo-6-deoxy-D-allose reductase [Shimia sp. SK013]|uniref:NAD-dependent epimerase/dehydratase family protein n=1 Tax=Shimia sp. SK013 TaxID=1389006 RepID=UPI0006B417AD|nr:NAD(P)-dependent oxidoreductase [Shimia sp. SK013]KPA21407.1 dTDP-4-oxo-6-deoxy-D-allose reductase [Shimia sp. SK013]